MKDGDRKEEQAFTWQRRIFHLHIFSRLVLFLSLWFYFSSFFLASINFLLYILHAIVPLAKVGEQSRDGNNFRFLLFKYWSGSDFPSISLLYCPQILAL